MRHIPITRCRRLAAVHTVELGTEDLRIICASMRTMRRCFRGRWVDKMERLLDRLEEKA